MNLAALGEENVRTYGEYVSLVFEGREWTNVDQQRTANRLANALRRRRVGEGDRVVAGSRSSRSPAAILKLGAVVVPVIFLLSAEEVRHILTDSGAKLVITSPELHGKVEGWRGDVVMVQDEAPGTRSYDELIRNESDAFTMVDRADRNLAVILYTSGTTGRPKGVALSHENLASNARSAASLYELDRNAWSLAVLPLSHSYGLTVMNSGNILGTKGVLLRWFNPELVLDTLLLHWPRAIVP